MPVTWVRVRHIRHNGETDIPSAAVERYKHRGWRPVAEKSRQNRRGQAVGSQTSEQSSEQSEREES